MYKSCVDGRYDTQDDEMSHIKHQNVKYIYRMAPTGVQVHSNIVQIIAKIQNTSSGPSGS